MSGRPKIVVGRKYRLRNGAEVEILAEHTLRSTNLDGKRFAAVVWIGRYVGTRSRCTWQSDGLYAPDCGIHPHELDIVEAA